LAIRVSGEEITTMALKIVRFANLVLAGLLTGNEFGSWAAVHPALSNLPAPAHIRAEQEIVRRYGKIMPFLMASTIALAIPVLALIRDRRSAAFRCTFAGAICFVAMLIVTLTGNVPINKRVLELSAQSSPEEFLRLRQRWDRLHTLRNLLNIAGASLLYLGALSRSSPEPPAGITSWLRSRKERP
jgi:uncharacterized membrane protein